MDGNVSKVKVKDAQWADDLPSLPTPPRTAPPPVAEQQNNIREARLNGGAKVINFNQGLIRPPRIWIQKTQQWIAEAAHEIAPWTMGRVAGMRQLREAVVDWRQQLWKTALKPENVLITTGANAAWNLVLKTISQPGDQVGITRPYFFNHFGSLHRTDRRPVFLDLEFGDEIVSLHRSVETVLAKNSLRAILLPNPHNPTGVLFPRQTINNVEVLCKGAKSWLVLDESYGGLTAGDTEFRSTGRGLDLTSTILIGSLTKSLALGDIRVGYVIAHENLINYLIGAQDDDYICTPQIMQLVAARAIRERNLVQPAMTESLTRKRSSLDSAVFHSHNLRINSGKSAVFGWLKLPEGVDDVAFTQQIAMEHGVILTPGSAYGAPGHVRMSYGMCEDPIEIELAIGYMSKLLDDRHILTLSHLPQIPQ